MCTLNEQQVWEDMFDDRDHVGGLWRDPVKNIVWLFASKGFYRYKIVHESRFVSPCLASLSASGCE